MNPIISVDNNRITVVSPLLKEPCRLAVISDYHCTLTDSRDDAYQANYARMAQWGYHEMETLRSWIQQAGKTCDALLLAGDIISYPAWKNVETLQGVLKSSPIPCFFTAGNHDWHFEGVPGSDLAQRNAWIARRLLPLYKGENPLCYAAVVKGVKILMIDNSCYHILPEQLSFAEKELAGELPVLLCMHIPLYLGVPGKESATGYGCGNPRWGSATDPYWQIEQREKWAEKLTPETFLFRRLLMESPKLIGIIAGHTHTLSADLFNQRFQFVAGGGVNTIELFPCSETNS